MKKIICNAAALFIMTVGVATAADINCGYYSIPESEIADLTNAECVGNKYQDFVIQGHSSKGAVIRFVQSIYDSTTSKNTFKTIAEVVKENNSALDENCVRGLMTARVIDDGKSVLLFYTEATVVKWTIKTNSVKEIVTRIDPGMASTCGGIAVGPTAMTDQLIFDSYHRFFVLNHGGELIKMKF